MREPLARWAAELSERARSLRPVRAESLHVTLCFLGNRPVAVLDAIGRALASVIGAESSSASPRTLQLATAGAVALPPRRPRVIAVALEDPGDGLARLQAAVAGALTELGVFRPDQRRFLPHVTVARVRRGERFDPARLKPGQAGDSLPGPIDFTAATVVLYRSRTAPGGSLYEALHSVSLERPA